MRTFLGSGFILATLLSAAQAQTPSVRPLVTEAVDDAQLRALPGNTHPLARPEFDHGPAPADLPMARMLLVLKSGPEQEAALETLLHAQQDRSSPQYHKWLTPQQFGQQFGPADQDIQKVISWLQSHGFQVGRVSNGRNVIEFSGTAGQVQEAFHTEIHKYVVSGQEHWANSSDPQIPVALAPVIDGIATLHNFDKKAQIVPSGRQFGATLAAGSKLPQFDSSDGSHSLAPGDYAIIYNINPVYTGGINGAGTTVAIVGRTNINVSDVTQFRSAFGLPTNSPQIIVNGPDPGDLGGGEEAEAVLDTSWAGATAPSATVKLVVSGTTNSTDGVDLSEEYIIDHNLGDVMTESFGDCEANYTQAEGNFYSSLAQQAAAEGITYTVAAGDSGAEGCDDPTETVATGPLSVNILSSTPYTVAVGGTEFNENGSDAYWGSINSADGVSALSYIPENVWNESCTDGECTNGNTPALWAGGGGPSTLFAKPSWQAGIAGIPSDGVRDVPDVSLSAAGHDAYLLCLDGSCTPNRRGRIFFQGYGGTSAATPSFAGIIALVVQATKSRQGQADNVLYRLAAAETLSQCNASNTAGVPTASCIFNDVTVGNNAVPGESGYGTAGALYQARTGYDLATGLGSMNVANLLNHWNQGQTGTPAATVSPFSLDFGTLDLGLPSAAKSVTLSNTGTAPLFVNISLDGTDADDFSQTNTCTTGVAIGASCTISVVFTPRDVGSRTASLSVTDNAADSPQAVTLSGVAESSTSIVIVPGSASFGAQNVTSRSPLQTITIANSTLVPVSIGGIAITGTNTEDFAQANNCPVILASGVNCTIFVVFSPQLLGNRAAAIVIGDNAPGAPQTVGLTGTGAAVGQFEIVNRLSGEVLDVTGASTSDGTSIQQWSPVGDGQQQWELVPLDGGYYEIMNSLTGKLLDVTGASTSDGTLIQQWSHDGGLQQQWQLVPIDDVHYNIVNRLSGKMLDVENASTTDGALIQQWASDGSWQQQWQLVPLAPYNIVNRLSGKVLDVVGASTLDGTLIQQWDPEGFEQQQWRIEPVGGGYYRILNSLSDKVLDVTGASTSDGTLIQQWDYDGSWQQQWRLVLLENGYYEFLNRLSGKVLDVKGASTSDGTPIQQWSSDGGWQQQWMIVPAPN